MNKNIINVTALDGLIKLNSFFSVATLISIIIAMLFKSLENPATSSNVVAEKLLINLAISFSSFLFAWLFAQFLKLTAVKRYMETRDLMVRVGIALTAFFSGVAFHLLFGSMKDVTGAETTHKMLSFSSCYMGLLIYFVGLCHLVFRGKDDDPE